MPTRLFALLAAVALLAPLPAVADEDAGLVPLDSLFTDGSADPSYTYAVQLDNFVHDVFRVVRDTSYSEKKRRPRAAPTQKDKLRQKLVADGHPFTADGFTATAQTCDVNTLLDYVQAGMDVNAYNALRHDAGRGGRQDRLRADAHRLRRQN